MNFSVVMGQRRGTFKMIMGIVLCISINIFAFLKTGTTQLLIRISQHFKEEEFEGKKKVMGREEFECWGRGSIGG